MITTSCLGSGTDGNGLLGWAFAEKSSIISLNKTKNSLIVFALRLVYCYLSSPLKASRAELAEGIPGLR